MPHKRAKGAHEDGEEEDREESEDEVRFVPSLITDHLIAEMIWNGVDKPWFLVRRFGTDRITSQWEIELENKGPEGQTTTTIYKPLDNQTLRSRLVLVPNMFTSCTFSEAYNDGFDLATKIYRCSAQRRAEVKLFVGIAQASWFLDRLQPISNLRLPGIGQFAPIIVARGPSGSGKDRFLNALRFSAYRCFYDASTKRIPSLFRPLDQWKGSLFVSEMDIESGDETSEVVKYLNCRAQGTPYSRQNPNDPRTNDVFENFGLTVVTQRRGWPDDATENRSLIFPAEKTDEEIPTLELDEWIEEGMALQNKLVYLRLMHWEKVHIDKVTRIRGLRDHRTNSALLPLLAISKFEPELGKGIDELARILERRKIEAKAGSSDGLVVNALWEKLGEGLFAKSGDYWYVGTSLNEEDVIPLLASEVAERLSWNPNAIRKIVKSLQLHGSDEVRQTLRVGKYTYRPIWFDPIRLGQRLYDFVPGYRGELYGVMGLSPPSSEGVTNVTPVTDSEQEKEDPTVTAVTDVTPSAQVGCSVCGKPLGKGTGNTMFWRDGKPICADDYRRESKA